MTRTPYINRELSWLEFNARVLFEAQDERNPLLERVRYLTIFTTNLDDKTERRTGTLVEFDHTAKIFSNPSDERTENYITGRFG